MELYADKLYKADGTYRRYVLAWHQANPDAVSVNDDLQNAYETYQQDLGQAWQKQVDTLSQWKFMGTNAQTDFYDREVAPTLKANRKIAVIISDALRYEAAQELSERKLIAPADVDTKRAQAKVDDAKLASSRTRLGKTEIRAPFTGTAGLRRVSPGEYVNIGDALVDFVARDTLKLDFSLPEVYLGRFQAGQKITISVDAQGARRFDGEVYAIAPQVDLATRSVTLRARVPNVDGLLQQL